MPKLVAGLFTARQDVSLLIADLQEKGIKERDISVIAKDYKELDRISADTGLKTPDSGTADNSIFGVLRGVSEVLEGARGEAKAVGPAAKKAAGSELWETGDHLAVPLIGAGVPEEDARHYHDEVAKGRFLVLVQCESDLAKFVNEQMNNHHSLPMN
ncbi:general stress protein [Paenibacillus yonginensis]|nr:general stress protein [Paenibacillus yonginensis]